MEQSGSPELFVDSSLGEIGAAQSTPPFSEAVCTFGNEPTLRNESMSSVDDMVACNATLQNPRPSQDCPPTISATIPFTVETPSQSFVPGCSCIGVYGVCLCGGALGLFTQVQASYDAETSIPHMRGGMLNAPTPLSVVQQLQAMGVPAALANAAAARHPDCINSALDWACDSERRHCSARVDSTALARVPTPPRSWGQLLVPQLDNEVVDLDTPPQDIQEGQAQILPFRAHLAVPASWTANIPAPLLTPTDLAQQYWTAAQRDAFAAADKIYHQELQLAATNATTSSITERLCATFLSLPVTPPQHYSTFHLTFAQLYDEEARLLHLRVNDLHSSRISLSEACATPIDVIGLCPFPLAVACILASSADIAPELVFAFFYSLCGWVCHHDLHAVFDPIKRDRRTRPRCMVQCICDAAAGKSPFWRSFVSPWFQGPDGIPSVFQTHPHLWSGADAKGLYIAQATDADLASRMQRSQGKLFWASPECWLLLDTAHAKRGADASKDKINFHYLLECQNGNDYGPRSIKSCPEQLHVATTNFGMLLLGQADTVHDFWGQVFRAGSPIRNKGFEGRPLFLFAGPARLTHPKQFISADLIFAFLKATLLQIADKAGHRVQAPFIRQPVQPQNSACWRSLGEAALQAEQDGPGACQVAAAKWGYSCAMSSLQTIYTEMCLPIQERAGTQAVASSGTASSSSLVPLPERALAKTLRRCLGKQYITMSDVKPHLTSTCRNQEHYCAVFDLAAQLQVGVPEGTYPGTRGAPYRLRLTLASMMPATRQRLGIEAGMGDVDPLPLPPIRGGGKRPASAGANKQGKFRRPAAAPKAAALPEQDEDAAEHRRKDVFSVESTTVVEVAFEGRDDFLKQQKAWAASTVPNQHVAVRHQFYPFSHGFKVLLWCKSCEKCRSQKGWRGYVEYDANAKSLHRRFTPISEHGDFASPVSTWNPLTSKAEASLKARLTNNPQTSSLQLLKLAKEQQATPIPGKFLQRWRENALSSLGVERRSLGKYDWTMADWQQLERELGCFDFDGVRGPEHELPNSLLVAASSYAPAETAVVLFNPQLFQQVLSMLSNKEYIKLSGDGTHKLSHDEWVCLTLGVLTKHYSSDGKTYGFRTTYSPLIFAIANTESQPTYTLLMQAAARAASALCNIDLPRVTRQYHADMHPGQEAARRDVFPAAARVSDFAHVIGATRPSSNHRSGLLSLAKNNLSRAGQRLMPLIEHTIHLLRVAPTALIFHTLASLLFDTLLSQGPPERIAVQKLQSTYFLKIDAATACQQYQVLSWAGDADYLWIAAWWCGLQRLQPGSGSGTQPQESWHRHQLKNFCGSLRTSIPTLAKNLEKFTKCILEQLKMQGPTLPDVPTEPFPDKWLLYDSRALTAEGRTSASQYINCRAFARHSSANSQFFSMRRTLATFNPEQKVWSRTPDSEVDVAGNLFAAELANLLLARDRDTLDSALRAICADPKNLNSVVKALSSRVLVMVGSASRAYWRFSAQHAPEAQDSNVPRHSDAVCSFCLNFALHGTCEHTHVAFVETGHISLTKARMPQWKTRSTPTSHMQDVDIILPGPSVPAEPSSASAASSSRQLPKPSKLPTGLRSLLAHADAAAYLPRFGMEELGPAEIAQLDFASVRAIFPDIPAAVLLRVLQFAQVRLSRTVGKCCSPCAILKLFALPTHTLTFTQVLCIQCSCTGPISATVASRRGLTCWFLVWFVPMLLCSIANSNCGCLMAIYTCICLPFFVLQAGTDGKPEETPSDEEMQHCFSQCDMSCIWLFVILTESTTALHHSGKASSAALAVEA